MLTIDADAVVRLTEFRPLVEAIREMFRKDCVMPVRHHHTIDAPGEVFFTVDPEARAVPLVTRTEPNHDSTDAALTDADGAPVAAASRNLRGPIPHGPTVPRSGLRGTWPGSTTDRGMA